MMKILVTGACGMLGREVMAELQARGWEAVGSGSRELTGREPFPYIQMDLTDHAAVGSVIARLRPDAVIHCAAWTAVDQAEEPGLQAQVYAFNAAGTEHLAEACQNVDAPLLYVSTDYVFDGSGTAPHRPEDPAFPISCYGKSKLAGEEAVRRILQKYFIVRISWLFGRYGKNFVSTMLALSSSHATVRVVDDQIGTPTYAPHLARLLADMAVSQAYGIYHAASGGGFISWYDFACEIFRQAGRATEVIPVSTAEYGLSRAPRPLNSRLDTSALSAAGFAPLPPWQEALADYLDGLTAE